MRIGSYLRALLSALIPGLISTTLAACPTNFYAEPVSLSSLQNFGVSRNIKNINSIVECAEICGRNRHRCRSAIYDGANRLCSTTFTWKIDCLQTTKRFNLFDVNGTNETIALIACVDFCNKTAINETKANVYNSIIEEENETNLKRPNFRVDFHHFHDDSKMLKNKKNFDDGINTQFGYDKSPEEKNSALNPGIITDEKVQKKVIMMPKPLNLEEVRNEPSVKKFESVATETHNNYDKKANSGGFFVVKNGKKPVQLVTISPEEFNKSTKTSLKKEESESTDTKSKTEVKARDSMIDMLMQEPIVVNGKMLHPRVAEKMLEYESTSTILPTATIPITDGGVVNTFIIEGVSDIFKEALADQEKRLMKGENSKFLNKYANYDNSTICYKVIPQQLLMSMPFHVLNQSVSRNGCRCACASTWKSSNASAPKCRSFQYYEKLRKCSLNSNDDSGKFDLVFDKNTEYHYVSCIISRLIKVSDTKCPKSSQPIQKTLTTRRALSTTSISSTVTTTLEPRIVTGKDSIEKTSNLFEATMNFNITTKAPNLEKQEVKIVANKNEPIDIYYTMLPKNTAKVFGMVAIPAELPESESEESTTASTNSFLKEIASTASTTAQTEKLASIRARIRDCFEVIDGFMMTSANMGLEPGLTIRECQCLCANSRNSHKYPYQCLSATYYHYDEACVLHMSNRQLMPQSFVRISPKEANTTYLGMLCTEEKSREMLVDNSLDYGCLTPLTTPSSNEVLTTASIPTTIPQSTTTTSTSNTDACFLELPHYVLEGNALAVETNVSVDECKCYCIDAPYRYGSDCQSVQYYYDSQTCLINKENRLTDPDRFSFDPQMGIMHSYFDYQCNSEKMILSMYVEQICEQIVEMSVKDAIGPPGVSTVAPNKKKPDSNNSASSDEISEEVENENEDSTENSEEDTSETPTPSPISKPVDLMPIEKEGIQITQQLKHTTISIVNTTTTQVTSTTQTTTKPIKESIKEKTQKSKKPNEELSRSTTSTTTTEPTTEYPPVGPCRYSALYQTVFNGARMIKRIIVTSPAQCFAACHAEGCRSANLIQYEGLLKYCEMFRDSIVDFRRTDVLSFDRSAVHFDSIRCEDKVTK